MQRHPGESVFARVCVSGTLCSSLQPLYFLPPGEQQPPSEATYPLCGVPLTRGRNAALKLITPLSPVEVLFNHSRYSARLQT